MNGRREQIEFLRVMAVNFDAAAEGHEEEEQPAQAELWHCRAKSIRWALGYVERHVNLETGGLTIPLEDEEAA